MSDVFISDARETEQRAREVADALRAQGHSVWYDDELPASRVFGEVIEERLREAKAVVVIWSTDAAKSHWVRAEADVARKAGTLVQIKVDNLTPPLPFNQIQCVNLVGWTGDLEAPGWRKVVKATSVSQSGPPLRPHPARRRAVRSGRCWPCCRSTTSRATPSCSISPTGSRKRFCRPSPASRAESDWAGIELPVPRRGQGGSACGQGVAGDARAGRLGATQRQ